MSVKQQIIELELAKENIKKYYQNEIKKLNDDMTQYRETYRNERNAFLNGINIS